MCSPPHLVFLFKCLDHVDEGGVESFTITITLRTIASCPQLGDFGNFTQVLEWMALKIGSLISYNLLRKSIFTEEVIICRLSCGHGCLVESFHCLSNFGIVICNDENVNILVCSSMLNSEVVHMDKFHGCISMIGLERS